MNIERQRIHGNNGFTLIELLIVVAIIGILAAIAIPGYLGMQERGRKGTVIRVSTAIEPELQAWLHSALRGVSGRQHTLREVDSNGDGIIDGNDVNNWQLGTWYNAGTLGAGFVNARQSQFLEKSPWNPAVSLFVGGAINASTANQINVAQNAAGVGPMQVVASDKNANVLHNKFIYSD